MSLHVAMLCKCEILLTYKGNTIIVFCDGLVIMEYAGLFGSHNKQQNGLLNWEYDEDGSFCHMINMKYMVRY